MFSEKGEEVPQEFQIIFSGKDRDTFLFVLVCHFAEIGRVKEDQVGFFLPVDRPEQFFGIPSMRFDFRPCLGAVDQIKRPALPLEIEAGRFNVDFQTLIDVREQLGMSPIKAPIWCAMC